MPNSIARETRAFTDLATKITERQYGYTIVVRACVLIEPESANIMSRPCAATNVSIGVPC